MSPNLADFVAEVAEESTTANQRKLFFNLRKAIRLIADNACFEKCDSLPLYELAQEIAELNATSSDALRATEAAAERAADIATYVDPMRVFRSATRILDSD
jgi:hypothetical protein